jgi:serine/threonine protein kinase
MASAGWPPPPESDETPAESAAEQNPNGISDRDEVRERSPPEAPLHSPGEPAHSADSNKAPIGKPAVSPPDRDGGDERNPEGGFPDGGRGPRRVRVGCGEQSQTYLQLGNGFCAVKCYNTEYDRVKLKFELSTRLGWIHELICPIRGIVLGVPDSFCEVYTEFMEHGSLAGIIDRVARGDVPHFWTPTNKAIVIVSILILLDKLHSKGFAHGNVDPKSFLINELCWACAHDFLGDGMEGRARYQASEVGTSWAKTPSADMFAFGMLLYEVVMGRRAYQCNGLGARGEIDHGKMPSFQGFPYDSLRQVIRNCWAKEPGKRCTAHAILDRFEVADFKILPGVDAEKVCRVYKILHGSPILHQ